MLNAVKHPWPRGYGILRVPIYGPRDYGPFATLRVTTTAQGDNHGSR
jgi:hypothetical protein